MELKMPRLRRGRRTGLETAPPTATTAAPGPSSLRDRLRRGRRTAVADLAVALAVLLAIYALALYVLRPDTSGRQVPLDIVLRHRTTTWSAPATTARRARGSPPWRRWRWLRASASPAAGTPPAPPAIPAVAGQEA